KSMDQLKENEFILAGQKFVKNTFYRTLPIPPVMIVPEAFDLIKNLVENNVKLYPKEDSSTMITAKAARTKTEEKVDQLLIALSLTDIESSILKEAAKGGSSITWK